jgi:ATP-dependent Lon protease
VIRTYLDTVIDLPWNKSSKDKIVISKVQKALDKTHYGLDKVKKRIIEQLAVRVLSEKQKGQIICLAGPPGVGKTSIAQSIAKAIGRKSERIALGGVRDEAEIRGHRKTYIGSMPGRIINALQHAGTNNPVLIFDEIDKLAADYKGDPTSALLEVLDIEQNNKFVDHYIELPFDLSNVMFITTANDISAIPAPLRDRMEIIEISSYTREEKFHIAKKHLIPKQLGECGFTSKELKFTQKAIYALIDFYTREAGVRTLERLIASVMRKCAVEKLTEGTEVFKIDEKEIERLLGHKKFIPDSLAKMDEIGIVNGLAWTSVGGEILPIEVAVMEGTGKIELTGSLGDVMQESAKTAITCIRSHASVLGIDSDFYKNKDIHIHAPEGAVPKDGPSAGITMATAIYSALTLKPARHDIAMTGEITLRGNVLPIGGLKEKSMAAFKNGITTVIIPKDNEPDLEDVDKAVLDKVKFIPVRNFSEVVALAVNNTVRITDNQWNGIDMTAVRSATKTVNAVKQ